MDVEVFVNEIHSIDRCNFKHETLMFKFSGPGHQSIALPNFTTALDTDLPVTLNVLVAVLFGL